MLYDYVENQYHQNIHSSIKAKPIDRFTEHIDKIRFVSSRQELDYIFLYRVTRKVKNDATVPISNVIFETPSEYIGEQVKISYDPTSMDKAYIFSDDGKCLTSIYPVNKNDNAKIFRNKTPKKSLDFSSFGVIKKEND